MSLSFTNAASNVVNVGSGSSLANIRTGTILTWLYPTTQASARVYQRGTLASIAGYTYWSMEASSWDFSIKRSVQDIFMKVLFADLPAWGTNKWVCLGVVWDQNGANTDQRMFGGDLTTLLTETSTYTNQAVGSGSFVDDTTVPVTIGNNTNNALNWEGRIAAIAVYNKALSLNQAQSWQYRPRAMDGCVGFWRLGWNGTGTQPDWSGNGNNGTVTGATQDDDPPLRSIKRKLRQPQQIPSVSVPFRKVFLYSVEPDNYVDFTTPAASLTTGDVDGPYRS